MAPSRHRSLLLSLLASVPLFSLESWAFECSDIVAQGVHFDLSKLGGPHLVHYSETDNMHDMQYKYNFTLDLCNPLKWHKGGTAATECSHGTRVCGIREDINLAVDNNTAITPIDIAGRYKFGGNGRDIDAKFELLSKSKSNADQAREGVRIALHGGRFPNNDKKTGVDQRAIIEFVCDKDRTGLEGDEKDPRDGSSGDDDDAADEEKLMARDEDNNDKGKCEDSDASLRFCGYRDEKDDKDKTIRTLRLEWRTEKACEDAPADSSNSSHWGFFGWFFIILFLAIASYLIFGSWLNYNRYGARGWDLLPHGDTLRDIPYIAKDIARKVMGSVQGGGSRGGYAAV